MLERARPPSALPIKKLRLAIVSTFDELCGIAGYTRFLIKQLEADYEIEVFDLDQFFMRSTDRNVLKLADAMVKEFCAQCKSFDFVNIQLEHGTLGMRRKDIWRRFAWIAKAAPALSVTFHTILPQEKFDIRGFIRKALTGKIAEAGNMFGVYRTHKMLTTRMFGLFRRMQKFKPVNVIVHTRRDARLMRYVNRIKNVHDHPLAFLSDADVRRFQLEAAREKFALLSQLPVQAKVIGVFGFLNDYKGTETAIRALQRLPKNYHLAIFGALHPNEIKRNQKINPYVKKLLDEAYVDRTVLDDHSKSAVSFSIDSNSTDLLFNHPRDVSSQLHFMGAQTDEDFARAMVVCDYALFPYLEVGQSASGPISIALEMGVRIIAARTGAFLQFARYHPNSFEMFEIGNHLELAERILAPPSVLCGVQPRAFNAQTNRNIYSKANSQSEIAIVENVQGTLAPPKAINATQKIDDDARLPASR